MYRHVFEREVITNISGGGKHAAALGASGKVYVWGRQTSGMGELGLGTSSLFLQSPFPLCGMFEGKMRFSQVVCGALSTAVVTADRQHIYMWGSRIGRGSPLVHPTLLCRLKDRWNVLQVFRFVFVFILIRFPFY